MTLQQKKDIILFQTKQINSLKIKRNKLAIGSPKRMFLVKLINLAETELEAKRKFFKL